MVREIHGGWGSVTVLVNGDHIYRFARTAAVAAAQRRELARDRLRAYWWLVPVHELLHGLATDDAAIVAEARAELANRLSVVGRARRV
jgi:hypothetical protein